MTIIATTLATNKNLGRAPLPWWARVLRRIIPAANPDFEPRYGDVTLWWVEIDESGLPQREIGFDAAGLPIVVGPFERNYGFWTDSAMTFNVGEYKHLSQTEFDEHWESFARTWSSALASAGARH
jgi:hypothetical protein